MYVEHGLICDPEDVGASQAVDNFAHNRLCLQPL